MGEEVREKGNGTTQPVDSSARSGQLSPYVPDNATRRYNYTSNV